jgi:hypothetical protein
MGINLDIELTHNHVYFQNNITFTIILSPEDLPSDTQVIINIGIRNYLKIGIWIAIKEVSFSLRHTLNSDNVETVFFQVGVVFVHDQTIGVVWLYFKWFVINFRLLFL